MNGRVFIGPKGGEVAFLGDDGVVNRTIPLAPGAYASSTFEKLRHPGETVAFSVPVLVAYAASVNIRHPGHFDSAANPSFRVSPAQRQAKQLSQMMLRSEALNRSAQKALQAARRAKKAVPKIEHQKQLPEVKAGEGEVSST